MKKVFLFLFIILIASTSFVFAESLDPNEWEDPSNGYGHRDVVINFKLADGDGSTYKDVGFSASSLNMSTGAVTKYENNSLAMSYVLNASSMDLSATTYAYWHVAIEKPYKIQLVVTPKEEATVSGTYVEYIQSSASGDASYASYNRSFPASNTARTFDLVTFTKLGRQMGASIVTINSTITNANFPDNVVCTLTLQVVSV